MSGGPQHLDQYELQHCLRRDTMSELWKAFDPQRRRQVTIALLRFTRPADEVLPHFLRETRLLMTLRHAYLVPICEMRIISRTSLNPSSNCEAYVVMDYNEDLSLTEYFQALHAQQKLLVSSEIMHILAPIGEATDYLHQQGIIHGLITPQMIVLSKQDVSANTLGDARLMNLGMYKTYDPYQLSSHEVCYIAPEIIQGEMNNVRSDLYSLGIILYEMCTGMLPFRAPTTADVISQQLNAMPPSPVLYNPSIRPALTSVIMRALAKDPSGRFASTFEMVQALAKALQLPTSQISAPMAIEHNSSDSATLYSPTLLSPLTQQVYPPEKSLPVESQQSSPYFSSVVQSPFSNPSLLPPSVPRSETRATNDLSGLQSPQSVSSLSDVAQHPVTRPPQEPMTPPLTPGSLSRIFSQKSKSLRLPNRRISMLLTALILLLLMSSSIGWLFFSHSTSHAPQKSLAAHAFFVSSGLMNLTSSSGITDHLQVRFANISAPPAGKSYYAWLLPDTASELNVLPLQLGTLAVQDGQAALDYSGDADHTNLLSMYSRLLITQEDASLQPVNPSLDPTAWIYSAVFSHTPNPRDTLNHFSLINHLRHLLAQDPKLAKVNLVGGLDTWLYRNTLKILEWTGSARDLAFAHDDTGLIRRQLVRILDYLDSSQFVQTENLPPDLASTPILADPTIARVGLLQISSQQEPPGYLKHISTHLNEITQCPGVTAEQKQLAMEINSDINNVQAWLVAVHADAVQLLHMPSDQLVQARTFPLFSALFVQANKAFIGQVDPHTGQVKEGVAQIHYKIQSLATFDITPCTTNKAGTTCAGGPF